MSRGLGCLPAPKSDTKAELVLSSPLEVNLDMIFTLISFISQLSHKDTDNKHRHNIVHCTKLIPCIVYHSVKITVQSHLVFEILAIISLIGQLFN